MRLLSVASLLAFSVSTFAADDWPGFRGPNRTGLSDDKGLLKSWPAEGPELAWKCTGLGTGFSSVAIVGNHVFTMGDAKDGCYVFCIDRTKGEKIWETKVGKTGGNYAGPRCTPAVDSGLVFALGQFGDFVCLNASDGKDVWRKNFKTDFKGQEGGWNYTESPLIDGEKLVVTPGGKEATMVAMNKKTGEVIWKGVVPNGDSAGYSSIVVAEIDKKRQYIQLMANALVGFDAQNGKMLWRYGNQGSRFAGNTANIPTPIVKGNQVFASAGYGRGAALLTLSASSDGTFTAQEEYFVNALTNKHGGVIMVGDNIYGDRDDSGQPWCAEFKTGKVKWKRDERTKGSGSVSLTYADGMLYLRYNNGWVALVDANGDKYQELGAFKVPNGSGDCWSHPVVVGGKLYLREQDTLWVHNVKAK